MLNDDLFDINVTNVEDEWFMVEIDELRQTCDEQQDQLDILENRNEDLIEENREIELRMEALKQNIADEARKENATIANKAIALSNIVDEYNRVLDQYVVYTGAKLMTDKLKRLLKEGGFRG